MHASLVGITPSKSATDLVPPPMFLRTTCNTSRHFSLGQDTHTEVGGLVGGGCKVKMWSATNVVVTRLCNVDVKKIDKIRKEIQFYHILFILSQLFL